MCLACSSSSCICLGFIETQLVHGRLKRMVYAKIVTHVEMGMDDLHNRVAAGTNLSDTATLCHDANQTGQKVENGLDFLETGTN